MSGDDLVRLENVINDALSSIVDEELQDSDVVKKAQRFVQQQKRLQFYLSPVLALKNSTVHEIQSYAITKSVTEDVMKATFITLGENPNSIDNWKDIRKRLKPSGDVIKRIKKFRIDSLHDRTADRAKALLDKYTTDDVREISAGVATFYQWSTRILQEVHKNNGDDTT